MQVKRSYPLITSYEYIRLAPVSYIDHPDKVGNLQIIASIKFGLSCVCRN